VIRLNQSFATQSGEKLPRQPVAGTAVDDPQRHFATVNCRIAKGLSDRAK
jgi:hypothetical protein